MLSLRDVSMTGGRGHIAARVLAISDRAVALEALDKADVLRLPDGAVGALLSFPYREGLVALRGTLSQAKTPGDLRFVPSDHASNRRTRGTRMRCVMPVQALVNGSGSTARGFTSWVGPDGVTVEFADGWEPAGAVELVIDLESAPSVKAVAKAVGTTEDGVELQLSQSSSDARHALGTLVVSLSRASVRRRESPYAESIADF